MNRIKFPLLLGLLTIALIVLACAPTTLAPTTAPTISISPTPSPSALSLTVDALKNAEYQSEWPASKKVKLTDGHYEGEMEWNFPGPAPLLNRLSVWLEDKRAFGDLNGDGVDDAVVILVTNTGGSGMFKELAAVVNDMGMPRHVASTGLGDRTKIESLSIKSSGKVTVEAIVVGPGDQFCCPTHRVTGTFRLEADKLVEAD